MAHAFGNVNQKAGAVTVAGAWTPAALPGLRGWWVPDFYRQANGSPVLSLPTLAGPANTLTAPDPARAPLYGTVNGRGAIVMDGTDDSLFMSDLAVSSGAAALTYFFLLKFDSIQTSVVTPSMMGIGVAPPFTGTPRLQFSLRNIAGALKPWVIFVRDADNTATQTIPSATNADLLTHVVIVSANRAPAGNCRTEIWLDGLNILMDDRAFVNPTWANTESMVGHVGSRDTGGVTMIGNLMQAGITRSAFDQATREKLEGYLANFGGISGQLPPAHPYFSTPP